LFLIKRKKRLILILESNMSIAKVLTAQPGALKAQLVNVETDVSVGIYNFLIVGLPNKEVDEAKDRVAAAIKNSDIPHLKVRIEK
jgi:magnesium chelatase family protein